jgi:uncharacterized protein (TIGR02145 family)
MKKNNLMFGTFLVIIAILFSSCRVSPSSENPSTEKFDVSTESIESDGVVTIGTQIWTSKNLNVSTYRNGDTIPYVQDPNAWAYLTTGAWCYYDTGASVITKYGKLYNWYAVSDLRGLAPNGYHIPTIGEWNKLCNYLGGVGAAGTKMKSTSGWSNNGNGTNSSGFSGLPGVSRSANGVFGLPDRDCYWWSSTDDNARAWNTNLSCSYRSLSGGKNDKGHGFSVRCLRD